MHLYNLIIYLWLQDVRRNAHFYNFFLLDFNFSLFYLSILILQRFILTKKKKKKKENVNRECNFINYKKITIRYNARH